MKRVLLLGAGAGHLQVLQALARQAPAGAELMLLAPSAHAVHARMLPGLVAGAHTPEQCCIPLAPLAAAARVSLVQGQVTALDAAARRVQLADGRSAEYDVLSIDVAAVQPRDALPGAPEHAIFLRPLDAFIELQQRLRALAVRRALNVVVLGQDLMAFELTLALQQKLDGSRIALVRGAAEWPAGSTPAQQRAAARVLMQRRITVFPEAAAALRPGAVVLASGARVACDAALMATPAVPPPWLAGSGLALDPAGRVVTGPTLQSRSHPEVFALGDAATHTGPGVTLALNLQRFVGGGALLPGRPGAIDRLARWWDGQLVRGLHGGPWGRLVEWGRDRHDRAHVARYAPVERNATGFTRAGGS